MGDIKSRINYVRVSNIVYPFSGLDKIDPEILANAASRGTKVHKICEAIISGIGEIGADEEVAGYIESFKKWWGEGHQIEAIERRFWDDALEITGQCDLVIKTDSGLRIIDFKTSYKPSPTWRIQGNAYAYLAKQEGMEINSIQFIHLLKDGRNPKIYEYELDFDLFLSVYKTWKYFYS